MKKIFLLSLCSLIIFLIFSEKNIFAAKRKIVRKSTGITSNLTGSRMAINPTLRSDRNGLIVNFSNLNLVSEFIYELTYTGDGLAQGASGTVKPDSVSTQRELLFGTCSKNVCKYHTGKKDMRLVVTYALKSGNKYRRSFSIRI